VPSMSKWSANSCSVKTRSPSLSSFWKNPRGVRGYAV
jgi:hypothetical protein